MKGNLNFLLLLRAKFFKFLQKMGINITLNNFYSPIPDISTLNNEIWQRKSELLGINLNEENQIKLLKYFLLEYKNECDKIPLKKTSISYEFFLKNGSFQFVDACILYCMIRHYKPKKIFEIGSGNSTYLCAKGLLHNQMETGYLGKLIAIDPYPNNVVKKGFPGFYKLYTSKLEDIDLSFFNHLEENDILLIDSTHVLKIGGDVKYLYLDLIPRLKKGVLIHIHDIFLPFEYPKEWIYKYLLFWNEQYLFQAFMTYNDAFEVIWAGNFMGSRHMDKLHKMFTTFDPTKVKKTSFWIKKKL